MKGHHVVKVDGYFRSNWIKVRISWTDIFQISLVRIEKKRRSLLFATNYISKRLNLELQTHFSVVSIQNIIKDKSLNRIKFNSFVMWCNDCDHHVIIEHYFMPMCMHVKFLRHKKLKISIQVFLSNAEVFETRILKRSDGTYAFYTDLKIHIWYNWYFH